jgi:hypothetical protein
LSEALGRGYVKHVDDVGLTALEITFAGKAVSPADVTAEQSSFTVIEPKLQ